MRIDFKNHKAHSHKSLIWTHPQDDIRFDISKNILWLGYDKSTLLSIWNIFLNLVKKINITGIDILVQLLKIRIVHNMKMLLNLWFMKNISVMPYNLGFYKKNWMQMSGLKCCSMDQFILSVLFISLCCRISLHHCEGCPIWYLLCQSSLQHDSNIINSYHHLSKYIFFKSNILTNFEICWHSSDMLY